MSKKISPLDKPRPRALPVASIGLPKRGENLCQFLFRIRDTEKDIAVSYKGALVPLGDVPSSEWASLVAGWWEGK